MRRFPLLFRLAPLLGVASAQSFVPDSAGFDSAVGVVMALVISLGITAIVVGILWFIVTLWVHRGG